jgi:uncharacterized membrane protein
LTGIRETLRPPSKQTFYGFRIRGPEVSRVEGFSDAVFGFVLTLLVVRLDVPKSFNEMIAAMKGFPAFAICFAIFYGLWNEHYAFFRKYGLEDGITRWLNGGLMFVILWFVYPLKFLFTLVVAGFTGVGGEGIQITNEGVRQLMVVYSLGYACISTIFALMHYHAYRLSDELELTPYERALTRLSIWDHSGTVVIALVSIGIALIAPPMLVQFAGWIYGLIGVLKWRIGESTGRAREEYEAVESNLGNEVEQE